MLTFNRIFWPLVVLALIYPEVHLFRADSPGILIPALIQLGISVFIWHDWKRK